MTQFLQDQLFLDSSTTTGLHCRDRDQVAEMIRRIVDDGADNLAILTDFDRTMTQYNIISKTNGRLKGGWSSYEVFQDSDVLPPEYREEDQRLRDNFLPIEIDPHLTVTEKLPHMVEWWTRQMEIFAIHGLRKQNIAIGVAKSDIQLRKYCKEVLVSLNQRQVPVLFLSAGVGETIEEILRQQAIFSADNMTVVANRLLFNEDGLCVGRSTESALIHVFNKGDVSASVAARLGRRNVIVMGDALADLDVIIGHEANFTNILKIGFLNVKENEQLDRYKAQYDVVLTGDPGLDLLWSIVQKL